jgi:flagellar operon protein
MAEINGISVPFLPIDPVSDLREKKVQDTTGKFGTVFQEELEKIKFSNHALKRLESRNINLSDSNIGKIQNAVDKAEQKGAKDSLIMLDGTAYVVNIPNKTVVTAIELNEANENIFTNIDSVVFTN